MAEFKRPSLTTGIAYRDPRAAIQWLEQAFGFETLMVVLGEDGGVAHSELRLGDGMIFVGGEWDANHRSPASLGGINTQSVHVQLESGLDAHCERARAAGAVITREPADQFYGDRSYAAVDPEGHVWTFAQTVHAMSHAEMAKAGGVEIREKL
jgi:uncharacterized glyoxalase superfamily protein PhnB